MDLFLKYYTCDSGDEERADAFSNFLENIECVSFDIPPINSQPITQSVLHQPTHHQAKTKPELYQPPYHVKSKSKSQKKHKLKGKSWEHFESYCESDTTKAFSEASTAANPSPNTEYSSLEILTEQQLRYIYYDLGVDLVNWMQG